MRDFIILGASGNLAKRKLFPALLENFKEGYQNNYYGFGRTKLSDSEFRSIVKDSVSGARKKFLNDFKYFTGDYSVAGLKELKATIKDEKAIFYLAVPTRLEISKKIITALKKNNLLKKNSIVVLEKPFGTDYQSAQKLMSFLEKNLSAKNVYLIDHYLAKDLVRNLITLRFANPIFSNQWNSDFIDMIEIEASETTGIEGRGEYYEKSGAIRDMIQNHVLQVLSLVVMEQPKNLDFSNFYQEKVKVFENLRMFKEQFENNINIAQYQDYVREKGVAQNSLVETSVSLNVEINNQRWRGVAIKLKTGKKMEKKQTQITIHFKAYKECLWHQKCSLLTNNKLIINLFPHGDIKLQFNTEFNPEKNLPKAKYLSFDFYKNENVKIPYANALKDIFNQDRFYTPSFQEILLSWKFIDKVEDWLKDKRKELLEKY
jgi:glucose-6-phosphate 1-dehydrogenase